MGDRACTLAETLRFEGVGIHSGEKCRVWIHPHSGGVEFAVGRVRIPALVQYAVELHRRTALEHDGVRVSTCEHLLAALYGCGVDAALVEVEGPEIPILDGSAFPFVEAIRAVGLAVLDDYRCEFRVLEPVWVAEGSALLAALPPECGSDGLSVHFALNAGSRMLVGQAERLRVSADAFADEIAPARTWCLAEDVDALISAGLARGGSADNTLVVYEDSYSKPLRVPNEPVRHKILDLVGDAALLGARLTAELVGIGSGHRLNVRLFRQLADGRLIAAESFTKANSG
ncbi:MAG: UDP-3-O-acyl-N-acetylglucosamine deacetylase [Armatimonadota bacterium]